MADYYTAYLPLLAILALGVGLVVAMFTSNRLLRPTHRTAEKMLTYECGVDPVGEMGVFIGFIAVGLVYAWRKGVLTWT